MTNIQRLAEYLEATSIWKPASVQQEPHTVLTNWRVMLVQEKDIHFVGWAQYEGRVCSAVQSYDPTTKRGITRSGRIYELSGPSGYNSDAEYVWNRWLKMYGLTQEDVRDISAEYDND